MDNIAITTKQPSLTDHSNAVHDVLQVACNHFLFFKLSKSTFHTTSIDYMGVILEKGVTHMNLVKVAGIRDWPMPKCVKDIHLFQGFCKFYWPFIAGFMMLALPLNELTKKNTPFVWTKACQEAFDNLRHQVTSNPVLTHPDLTKQFKLKVDTLGYAVGAVLLQKQNNAKQHPVGYYSAMLNPVEHNYDILYTTWSYWQ